MSTHSATKAATIARDTWLAKCVCGWSFDSPYQDDVEVALIEHRMACKGLVPRALKPLPPPTEKRTTGTRG